MCCRSTAECIYQRCYCRCIRCKKCDRCNAGQKAKQGGNPMTLLALSLATKSKLEKTKNKLENTFW